MDERETIIVVTIISSLVSLLGQLFHFILTPKKSKVQTDTDVAAILKNITESYDKLFESLKERIKNLEDALQKEATTRISLEVERSKLTEEVERLKRKADRQSEEIVTLRKQIDILQENRKNVSK